MLTPAIKIGVTRKLPALRRDKCNPRIFRYWPIVDIDPPIDGLDVLIFQDGASSALRQRLKGLVLSAMVRSRAISFTGTVQASHIFASMWDFHEHMRYMGCTSQTHSLYQATVTHTTVNFARCQHITLLRHASRVYGAIL